jgi:hypothetical protein
MACLMRGRASENLAGAVHWASNPSRRSAPPTAMESPRPRLNCGTSLVLRCSAPENGGTSRFEAHR